MQPCGQEAKEVAVSFDMPELAHSTPPRSGLAERRACLTPQSRQLATTGAFLSVGYSQSALAKPIVTRPFFAALHSGPIVNVVGLCFECETSAIFEGPRASAKAGRPAQFSAIRRRA